MKDRNGGYTRIIRMGMRKQDAADMVVLELVDRAEDNKKAERDKRKADKKAKAKAKADAAEAEAEKAKE
jgi:large subunit ribosomal protein L17